ncbi:hypothetical protein [Pedobacter alluvionis]|uniref:Uncharacterized protein n=1 Tax=Pedobacter alluvionis TaxID=475253 RepID=A0A497Y6R5_9SPHI|nr:hypothetical protein [Pedobacter alluvionis]RLJ77787.1 hypothetical protein BCL90_2893 [Pedobacter alluvionis]TFB33015.1 hypothetical protein E3V97_02955 [Pedobacter alluvionis]
MNTKKIFYNDYDKLSGESFLDIDQILDLFKSLNWQKSTFLYFDINETETFQIFYQEEALYLIEIANDSEDMVYLQKFADGEQAQSLIQYYFEHQVVSTDGFYAVPIETKTLSDVIRETN